MAKIQVKLGDEYLAKVNKLSLMTRDQVCGRAIYAGAAVAADAVRDEIKSLPTDNRFVKGGDKLTGPGERQKQGLLDSLGVTPMSDDGKGFLNVKIGFDGYNKIKTKRWPKGQPNQMVARAIERGTSFMMQNPFMKRAVSKSKKRALAAMEKTASREIEKIMK